MDRLFSIGEMSKIHHIPVKTLRYYDEIDLLRPQEVNPDSGYRYYSYGQFEALNTIRFMKYLGIPLKEIKGYLAIRDKKDYMDLLMKEKDILEDKVRVFRQMLSSIEHQVAEVSDTMGLEADEVVRIRHLPKRYVYHKTAEISGVHDLELSLHELKGQVYEDMPIVIGMVGLTISRDRLVAKDYKGFDGIFIVGEEGSGTRVFPEGTYAGLHYRGEDHSKSAKYYQKICRWVEDEGYTISGDGIERVIINRYKSNNPDEYLTEIQVPVEKS